MRIAIADIKTLEMIRHFVQSAIFSHLHIKELCDSAEMSETKLIQCFKFLYQSTIINYFSTIKMEYAKACLEKDFTVKELSILLCYSSTEHFNRAFRKVFVVCPNSFQARK
ncbi:helix-turn-helix domain-containing protein [Chitinophaga sp. SYP-B3965]|uniref:helix-turn-helix domain-containing protein n=1 Tax=Chitinophaga sp. SYP-B3965 TaxID=2663120 RepID=UPI001299A94F|nr:AraC family transcriptional regulator [Chitinophaga sp. SYP-B3965]MRG44850.1 helix-turn-helix domain-containing protein [Chitinophaga sp. SYP-B3965]